VFCLDIFAFLASSSWHFAASKDVVTAADFANSHLVKIANALDSCGFTNMASIIDEAMFKIDAKKKGGRTYKQWIKFFNEKGKKWGEKFEKTYKGALEQAKKKGLKKAKSEEYAMRTALDKMPAKFFEESGPAHGPGKSEKLVTKRPK
jgi:hypothetical protein